MTPVIISIVGFSDSGKTTLMTALIPVLKKLGVKVSTIKHAAHGFDMDRSGKDTFRHKQAGADAVVAASKNTIALVKDIKVELSPLKIVQTYLFDADLVIVEGYKKYDLPKIETLGFGEPHDPIFAGDKNLIAIVGPSPPTPSETPVFAFNDMEKLAGLIVKQFLKS